MTHAVPHEEASASLLDALDAFAVRFFDRGASHAAHDDEPVPFELWRRALLDPAREFLRRPGKELRGRLTRLAWHGVGARGAAPRELLWIVELLHAGSLIIDDIQDDSALRRGAPALHHLVGPPLAINTGNWLYFFALSLVDELGLAPAVQAELYREITLALMRCHHGQALDLSVDVRHLEPRHIPPAVAATTRNKTGVLMSLAARTGAIAAGAERGRVIAISQFGEELGVGLQMLDDLGSIASRARRDKGLEDLRAGRPTWPWAWTCNAIDELAVARLQQRLRSAASDEELDAVMSALRDRSLAVGRAAVRAQLDRALALGRAHLCPDVFAGLCDEIARMEASYG